MGHARSSGTSSSSSGCIGRLEEGEHNHRTGNRFRALLAFGASSLRGEANAVRPEAGSVHDCARRVAKNTHANAAPGQPK